MSSLSKLNGHLGMCLMSDGVCHALLESCVYIEVKMCSLPVKLFEVDNTISLRYGSHSTPLFI